MLKIVTVITVLGGDDSTTKAGLFIDQPRRGRSGRIHGPILVELTAAKKARSRMSRSKTTV
jgi:hypothetical protein